MRAGPERALLQVGPSTLYLYYIIGGAHRGGFDACLVVINDQVSDPRLSGDHKRLLGAGALGFCERAQWSRRTGGQASTTGSTTLTFSLARWRIAKVPKRQFQCGGGVADSELPVL